MLFIFICSYLRLVSSSFLKKFMLYYGCVLPSCACMRLPVCAMGVRDIGGQNFCLSSRNSTVSYLFLPLRALTRPKLLFLQSLLGLQFCNDFHSLQSLNLCCSWQRNMEKENHLGSCKYIRSLQQHSLTNIIFLTAVSLFKSFWQQLQPIHSNFKILFYCVHCHSSHTIPLHHRTRFSPFYPVLLTFK